MKEKIYQLFEKPGSEANAGSKAPYDVEIFAREIGFKTLSMFYWGAKRNIFRRITGQIFRFLEYSFLFFRIPARSILFLQFPYVRGGRIWRKLFLSNITKLKKVKIITLYHDINELRNADHSYQSDLLLYTMNLSAVVIIHNKRMKDYLLTKGIPPQKMINLEVFDYSSTEPVPERNFKFERSISIAGNLASVKCGYLNDLCKIQNIHFHLYGTNFSIPETDFIKYHGVFSPEGLPKNLEKGFGLVWDGDSIDTCNGIFGNYLRFNNPHKFSLYIISGLPVVAWKESALADFIQQNRVGILVDNLQEAADRINSMGDDEYAHLKLNVIELSEKFRSGYYTKKALQAALNLIGDGE